MSINSNFGYNWLTNLLLEALNGLARLGQESQLLSEGRDFLLDLFYS